MPVARGWGGWAWTVPLLTEALLLWWTLNLLVDRASQCMRRLEPSVWPHAPDLATLSVLALGLALPWARALRDVPVRLLSGTATPPPSPPPPDGDGPQWSLLSGRRALGEPEPTIDVSGAAFDFDGSAVHRTSMLLLGLCAIPLCLRLLSLFREHRILGVLMSAHARDRPLVWRSGGLAVWWSGGLSPSPPLEPRLTFGMWPLP